VEQVSDKFGQVEALAGGGRLLLSGFRRHFFQRFGIGETGLKSCVS